MEYKKLYQLGLRKLSEMTEKQLMAFIQPAFMERIICSAIHINDGKDYHLNSGDQPINITRGFVVAGRRHGDCYNTIKNLHKFRPDNGIVPEVFSYTAAKDMGFLTNHNRFVYRKEALKIAYDAGQLINTALHEGKSEDDPLFILTSEDLFIDKIDLNA